MHKTNLIVNYLKRKYGVPLHNFFKNWTRGTSHLKVALPTKNIKVINSFYKGMHDMQRCLRL